MTYSYNHFKSSTWPLKQHVQSKTDFPLKTSFLQSFLAHKCTTIQPVAKTKSQVLSLVLPIYPSNPSGIGAPYKLGPRFVHISPNSTETRTSNHLIKAKNSKHFHLTWKLNYYPLVSLLASRNKDHVFSPHTHTRVTK